MALFKIFRGTSQNLPTSVHDGYAYFTTDDGKFYIDVDETRILINPDFPLPPLPPTPSAEDIQYIYTENISNVKEALDTLFNSSSMAFEVLTVRQWAERGRDQQISKEGCLYIYSDAGGITNDNILIPKIKIGDGINRIKKLPFIGVQLQNLLLQHINDVNIHVTELEKQIWSNKTDIEPIPTQDILRMMSL